MHVLRNVRRAVVPGGLVLDAHPVGCDLAVSAGTRGLGFVDASRFLPIVQAMDEIVAEAIANGWFAEVRSEQRRVAMRFDDPAEALEHADGWNNLRLPPAVRRRLRQAEGPVELWDTIRYRLMRVT